MKDLFLVLSMFMLIAHPALVAYIISQVETPFVIRIGLVIMTHAIVLAGLWFGSKTFTYLDDEPDPKKDQAGRLADEDDEKSRNALGFTFFILPLFLLFLTPLALATWDELQWHHQLLEEGGSTVATVQKCSKRKSSRGYTSCYMSYDYEVPLANNRTKLYRVREQISCARVCNIGSSVDITYLPQTPAQAGIERNTGGLKKSVFWLTLLFNFLLFQFSFFWHDLINWAAVMRWGDTKEVEIPQVPSLKDRPFKLDEEKVIIEALRTDPQNTRAWLILGWMMAEKGRPERARECYERALKINLRSSRSSVRLYEAGELSVATLPTWVDLVAAEEEVPLISFDLSSSSPPVPLPNWLDEEQSPSFFSHLRAVLFILLFFLMLISLPGWMFSLVFFGEAPLALFFLYQFTIINSLLPLTTIFYMLKLLHVSKDSRDWPTSTAMVIGSFVNCWKSEGKRRHNLYVVCAYEVDQQIYYSTVPSQNPYLISSFYQSGGNESDHYLEQKEKRYTFPKRMTVFYNPRQPHIAFHKVGFHSDVVELLRTMIVMALSTGFLSCASWLGLLKSGS